MKMYRSLKKSFDFKNEVIVKKLGREISDFGGYPVRRLSLLG